MTDKTELKPCPFCGAVPTIHSFSHIIECPTTGCRENPNYEWENTDKDESIKKWNTRTPQWQPIETAPMDGTPVLAYIPSGYQTTLIFDGDFWRVGFGSELFFKPTHWMPLPKAPNT